MQEVHVGIVGLGNVGSGTLAILAGNADQIALKLGFRLKVAAVCCRSIATKSIPESLGPVLKTAETKRRARYYTLTREGRRQLGDELSQYESMIAAIGRVLQDT